MGTKNSTSNKSSYLFWFCVAGFSLISAIGSVVTAGFSGANKFLPGFNEADDLHDIVTIFGSLSAVFLLMSLGAVYKIRQNAQLIEESNSKTALQVGQSDGVALDTLNLENNSLAESALLLPKKTISACKKFAWGSFGGLLSAAGFSVFLNIIRHKSARNHDFSNSVFTSSLIGVTVGVGFMLVLLGVILSRMKDNRGQTANQGCWARFTSCCRSSDVADNNDSEEHSSSDIIDSSV